MMQVWSAITFIALYVPGFVLEMIHNLIISLHENMRELGREAVRERVMEGAREA